MFKTIKFLLAVLLLLHFSYVIAAESSTTTIQALVIADWCPACPAAKAQLPKLQEKAKTWVVDFDKNKDWCKKYNVTALPTLLVWRKIDDRWYLWKYVGNKEIADYVR